MESPYSSTRDLLRAICGSLFVLCVVLAILCGILWVIPSTANPTHPTTPTTPITTPLTPPLFVRIISTNLVSVPCPCGFCKPDQGIAVPEHINQIGYDLKVVVSTSYYPVVSLPTH